MTQKAVVNTNRRSDRRHIPKSWTKVTCQKGTLGLGDNLAVAVLDVSETGIRLTVKQKLEVGQEFSVALTTPHHGRPVRLVGQVAWCVETAEHGFCVGIHFRQRLRYIELTKLT